MPNLQFYQDRVGALLRSAHLEEIWVFGNARVLGTATQSYPNLQYLLGIDTGNALCVVRLTRGSKPRLISPSFFLIQDLASQREDVETCYAPFAGIGRAVADSLGTGEIGLVGFDEMPRNLWNILRAQFDERSCSNIDPILLEQRVRLDASQVSYHRQAATLVDQLFSLLPRLLAAGEPAWMLQRRLEHYAVLQGADQCSTWMTVAQRADFCHSAKHCALQVPRPGDQLLFGSMLTVEGSWGHAIRTYHVGSPPPELVRLHDGVFHLQQYIVASLRPGQTLATLNGAVEQHYLRLFPGLMDAARRFRVVHGLGHSYEEPPSSRAFPQPFDGEPGLAEGCEVAADMLFEVHPNLFAPTIGGSAIGDMVLVGQHGNELLTCFPREISVV